LIAAFEQMVGFVVANDAFSLRVEPQRSAKAIRRVGEVDQRA
jgi:hypothetical protein